MSKRLFTEFDRRLARLTAVYALLVALAVLVAATIYVLAWVVSLFASLVLPLALAGVLALVFSPVVDWFQRRLGMPRLAAILMLLLLLAVAIAALLVLAVPVVSRQMTELFDSLPTMLATAETWVGVNFPELYVSLVDKIQANGGDLLMPAMPEAATWVLSLGSVAAGLVFVPLFMFFMLYASDGLQRMMNELAEVLSPDRHDELFYLGRVFGRYMTAFFQGQLIIAALMGAMYSIGFTLVGMKAAVLVGLVLGMLNIVPFLGAIVGLIIATPIAYTQSGGGLDLLLLVLAVIAVVQLIESWFLTPKIMGDKSGLHPAIVVISLFFWATVLDSVIGMILAVPLSAFVASLWRHLRANYSSPHVVSPDESSGIVKTEQAGTASGDTEESSEPKDS